MNLPDLHLVPLVISSVMLLASAAIVLFGRRHGAMLSRRILFPAAYVGLHGCVGVLFFVGRSLAVPQGDIRLVALALNVLGLLLLALAVLDADQVARSVREQLAQSDERAREHARARVDYERIMRHRLANPLMVVTGGLETLRVLGDDLDPDLRVQLLDEVQRAAARLERLAFDPAPVSVEEQGLDGRVFEQRAPVLAIA